MSIPHRDYFCFALFVFQHFCSWDHNIWFPTSFSCSLILKWVTAGYILISMLISQNFFCLDKTINRDCLWYHNGSQFVTWDNDPASNICCGGWWYKVNCISAQDSNLRIHWSRLDSSDAGKSAPTTTETKIRPVNFSKKLFHLLVCVRNVIAQLIEVICYIRCNLVMQNLMFYLFWMKYEYILWRQWWERGK